MSQAIVQEFKFVATGLEQLNQNIQKIDARLVALDKHANNLMGLDKTINSLNRSVLSLRGVVDRAVEPFRAMQVQMAQTAGGLNTVGAAAVKTGKKIADGLTAQMQDFKRSLNTGEYQRQLREFDKGVTLSEAKLRSLLKTTRLLHQAQNETRLNPEFAATMKKEFGSKYPDLMFRTDHKERVKALQYVLDTQYSVEAKIAAARERQRTAEDKALQRAADAQARRLAAAERAAQREASLQERAAVQSGKRAMQIAAADQAYQNRLSLLGQINHREAVSLKTLQQQLVYLQTMQAQYQHIHAVGGRTQRKGARDSFISTYGVAGWRDMPNVQARIHALQNEINQRMAGTRQTLGQMVTQSHNLHGVWRGMTAAAGQIWLSWGNFLPMMAGLAPLLATMRSINAERAFGWQMAQVGAAAEVGDKAVKQLGDSLLALGGGQYTQPPLQMAEALRVLTQAGLSTHDAFAALPSVLNLAMVAGTSDEDAALFASGLRHPFGLFDKASLQAGIDQTAKAANVSQTSIESMMVSFQQAAPAASKFGMSVADVSTVLAALARVNITGSTAGTAFKNLMTDLAGRTPKGREALEQLGLSAYNAAGMVKPLTQIIAELQDKFKGMNDQDKQRWMKSFLDERGMRAADVLLNMTTQDFRKLHEEIARGAENLGYTSVQAERLGNTSEGAFRKMKAAWETAFVRVGQEAALPFQGLMSSLTNVANDPAVVGAMAVLANGFIGIAASAVQAASLLTPLLPVLNGLAAGAAVLGGARLLGMAGGLLQVGAAASAVGAGLTVVRTQMAAMTVAMALQTTATAKMGVVFTSLGGFIASAGRAMTAFAAANPLTLLAVGLAGVVTYLSYARREAVSFADEMRRLPQDLGAVKTELYTAFNTFDGASSSGKGGRMDWLLGIQGDVLLDLKRGNKEASEQFVLDWRNSAEAFAGNLRKINEVAKQQMQTLSGSLKDSFSATLGEISQMSQAAGTAELAQAVMITERKKSLLETQLGNLDKYLAGAQELSREDMQLRQNYEQQVYDTAARLMTMRTELAAQQIRDLRVQAMNEMGVLQSFMDDVTGMFGDVGHHRNTLKSQIELLKLGVSAKEVAQSTGGSQADVAMAGKLLAEMNVSGLNLKAAYEKFFGSLKMADVEEQNRLLNNRDVMQAVYDSVRAKPSDAAAQAQVKLKDLEGLETRRRAIGKWSGDDAKAVAQQREVLKGILNYANQLKTQAEQEKAHSSKTQLAERKKALQFAQAAGEESGNPLTQRAVKHNPSTVKYSVAAPYKSTVHSEYAEEAAKRAQEQAKNAMERQIAILGFATDEVVNAYTATFEGQWQANAAKARDKARNQANSIREKLAKGEIAEADKPKALADIALLNQTIKSLSPKGEVDLGANYRKTVTTTQVPRDTSAAHTGRVAGLQGNYRVSSPFGWRGDIGIKGASKYHKGTDYATPVGTPLYAPESGTVVRAGNATGYGRALYLKGDSGRMWEFGHLSEFAAKVGQQINVGQLIAKTGDTGTGGAHLHVTIRRDGAAVNPEQDEIWTKKQVSGSLKSTAVNKKGVMTDTYENTVVQAENVRATNLEDGAEYQRLQKEAEVNKQRVESAQQARRELELTFATRHRELALQQQQLEAQKSMGVLTQEEAFAQTQALQTRQIHLDYDRKIAEKKRDTGASEAEIAQYIQLQNADLAHQLELLEQRQQKEAQSRDFATGVKASFAKATDEATNYAAFAQKQMDILINGVSSAFEQLALTGKVNFRELTSSMLKDLARVYARMAAMQLVSWIGNSIGGMAGGTAGGMSGGMSGGMGGMGLTAARGAAFANGNLTAYARGGIVDSPTYFGFNGGRGLMGEAGTEAIMPLQRMPNGDLGVMVSGSGGGGAVINAPVQVSVVVHQDGSTQSDVSGNQAKEMGEAIKIVVINEVGKMLRPNGMINSAIRSGGAA